MIRVIHMGQRPYDVALLSRLRCAVGEYQDMAAEPSFDVELPASLSEGVRFAFVVVPEGDAHRHTGIAPPSPFFELGNVISNSAWFPVYYDKTPAWVILIHK